MWHSRMRAPSARIYNALSLVEILLALSLGSFLLLLLSSLYSDFYLAQTKQREQSHLQQKAHQLLDYFQQHIQHLGYQGQWQEKSNFELFRHEKRAYRLASPSCLVFFYDLDSSGCLGNTQRDCIRSNRNNAKALATEIFGFKLENRQIWLYQAPKMLEKCAAAECKSMLNACSQNAGWERMFEKPDHFVEKLQFDWEIEGVLLKIELSLASLKQPSLQYHAVAYSYVLNGGER